MTLRPQVAAWERQAPVGAGITGLWRPVPGNGISGMMAFVAGDGTTVFSLRQDGSTLTGSVEGTGGGFFGGADVPTPIVDGKVDGQSISFKAGTSTFEGTVKGDQLELLRKIDLSRWLSRMPKEPTGPRPADWAAAGWIRSVVQHSQEHTFGHSNGSAPGSAVETHADLISAIEASHTRSPKVLGFHAGFEFFIPSAMMA